MDFDEFGYSVAVSGGVALIGAYRDNLGSVADVGSAYVYRFDGSAWLLEQAIPNPEPGENDSFGWSVSISGDVAVVGAYHNDTGAFGNEGSAYLYRYDGTAWLLEQSIDNPEPAYDAGFGRSVAVSGDVAVVAVPNGDVGSAFIAGSVYVYRYNGSTWSLDQTIANPAPAFGDNFGWSVSISGDVAVFGARSDDPGGFGDAGSAYVYRYNGSDWLLDQAIPNPEPTAADYFGISVAISGDVVVVGAYLDNPGGINNAGSAYVYRYNGSTWSLDQTIANPEPLTGDEFGSSVAVSGDVAVVGAGSDNPGGVNEAGSTYVYRYNGSAWVLDSAIPNPEPAIGDRFGISVAISGEVAVVGAQFDDPGGVANASSAYVFELNCTPCPGDVSGDSVVDLSDLTILLAHFGMASGATLADGDLDGDGDVDLSDLTMLLSNFGTTCP